MNAIYELAKELKKASKDGNIQKCIEISNKIAKIMETYKRSC